MKTRRIVLLAIALACLSLLGAAVYLQEVERMLPCPWCVIQRYVFLIIAIICLAFAALPERMARLGATLGFLFSLGGVGAASWLIWVQSHPSVSCGIDPVETALNKIAPAHWLPTLFSANGECTTEYPPILGLTVPQWSLTWFVIFAIALGWVAFRRR